MPITSNRAVFLVYTALALQVDPPRPQQAASWSVDAQPLTSIGADGDATLAIVIGAARLKDGSVLVGDRSDYGLKLFGADGTLRKNLARRGSGPGEIAFLGRMWRCGDSVFTYDIEAGRRISVFTLDGGYVREFRWASPAGQQTPYHSACNADGRFVHIGWEKQADMKGGAFRATVPVWTSRADSAVGRMIDSMPGSERWGLVVDGRMRGTSPLPLGKQPVIGIGRSRILLGASDQFEFRVLSLSGAPTGQLRKGASPRPVTADDATDAFEAQVLQMGEASRARLNQRFSEMTLPKYLPAYSAIIIDGADNAWVREFPRGKSPTAHWSVFSPVNVLIAEVDLPRNLEVYEIGTDYVLGRWYDPAEGVPLVRVYKLNRAK
jgi:hypothetical protein